MRSLVIWFPRIKCRYLRLCYPKLIPRIFSVFLENEVTIAQSTSKINTTFFNIKSMTFSIWNLIQFFMIHLGQLFPSVLIHTLVIKRREGVSRTRRKFSLQVHQSRIAIRGFMTTFKISCITSFENNIDLFIPSCPLFTNGLLNASLLLFLNTHPCCT